MSHLHGRSCMIHRRGLLQAGAGLALAGFAGIGHGRSASPPVNSVDVHHHYLPPFFRERVAEDMRAAGGLTPEALAWTPERSLAVMDRAGVGMSVVSIAASNFDFPGGVDMARRCNAYAAQMAADHPGRFRFFAALPMPDIDAAIREAQHVLDDLGAAGVGILTNYRGIYLGDAAFAPLFEMLDARNAVVYVHPTNAPCCAGLVPAMLDAFLEFPFDTARTISSLLWSGTFSRFPGIRPIFSHGGGALPMVMERVQIAGIANPEAAARVPEGVAAALGRLRVDLATAANPVAFAAVRAWLPPSHILFGTDYPWGMPDRTMRQLEGLGLSPQDLAAIQGGNARALLGG